MSKLFFCPLGHNNLIRTLPFPDRAVLEPLLKPVDLTHRMVLSPSGEAPSHVYFPTSGVGSIIASFSEDRRIEAGLFGNEGMSATALLLGSDRSSSETVIQVPGSALVLPADKFMDLVRERPTLHRHLLLFVQTLLTQASQAALANSYANIGNRLARWLLMCHDRIQGQSLELTHEFLSIMLGVRRAGVTVATHILEGKRLIRAERNRITIIDREGLEDEAHGIYGTPEAEYMRLLKPLSGYHPPVGEVA